ncbi:unnamed protein product, partial [Vitis vinifera]|uniref:Uncharacterized protein n=1 Tax=Vitis vinifera TaxID=29760 RepID=E0CSE5_VITVI
MILYIFNSPNLLIDRYHYEQKLFFKIQFPNTIFKKKTPKTVLKNCSQKLFSRTVFKNSNQTGPKLHSSNSHVFLYMKHEFHIMLPFSPSK